VPPNLKDEIREAIYGVPPIHIDEIHEGQPHGGTKLQKYTCRIIGLSLGRESNLVVGRIKSIGCYIAEGGLREVRLQATPLAGEGNSMGVTEENYELEEHVIWKGADQDRSTTI
jgi:hypothetical protein